MRRFFDKALSFLDREPELWKENVELVELNRRLLWFLLLRFGVASALFLLGLARSTLIPDLAIGSVFLFAIASVLFVLNLFYWFYYQWAITYHGFQEYTKMAAGNLQVQIILDFLILGVIVYECGGLESPLIYFFLFHTTLSCLFFRRRVSFAHTMISIGIIVGIHLLTSLSVLPERHFLASNVANGPTATRPFVRYYLAGVVSIYLIGWYLVSTITESLKAHERRLQEKIQEMILLAREKTRYMLVTTHELKAPFAAMQSYVNVALEGYAGEVSPKLREILQKIHLRCGTIARMITEMIQLANITSLKERRQDVTMSLLDLSQTLLSILPRFRDAARQKGLKFDTGDLAFERHPIEANAEQLDILLGNIISNAVSYAHPQTTVVIRIENGDGAATLSVRDRGIVIKKEHLEKVFLEHFRSEKAVEVNPNSTGLGLTIARQIMEIHRGRIWIESDEGADTTVFMEFPRPPEAAGSGGEHGEEDSHH